MADQTIVIPYKPYQRQAEFHNSQARIRLFLGGVRSGKSIAGANELVKQLAINPNTIGWCVAPTYPMSIIARDYLIKYMPRKIIAEEIKGEKRRRLINGSLEEIRSAENEDSLRGAGIDFCWIDEGAYITKYGWQIIQTRLSDRQGRCWITTTPKGRHSSWIYDLYMSWKEGNKDIEVIWCKTEENPYFPKEELLRMRKALPTNFYLQEYEAEFIDDGGQFRYEWFADCFDNTAKLGEPGKWVGIDLAIAKEGDMFVILGIKEVHGKIMLSDIYLGKGLSPKAMKEAIKGQSKNAVLVMVENNGFQQYLQRELIDETLLPIRGFTTGKQKADPYLGLPSVAAMLENHKFIIPRGNERSILLTDMLIKEALAYPSGHTGDILMALWFAVEGYKQSRGAVPIREIIKELEGAKDMETAGMLKRDWAW